MLLCDVWSTVILQTALTVRLLTEPICRLLPSIRFSAALDPFTGPNLVMNLVPPNSVRSRAMRTWQVDIRKPLNADIKMRFSRHGAWRNARRMLKTRRRILTRPGHAGVNGSTIYLYIRIDLMSAVWDGLDTLFLLLLLWPALHASVLFISRLWMTHKV